MNVNIYYRKKLFGKISASSQRKDLCWLVVVFMKFPVKERVHSEMKISRILKEITVIKFIRFISFRLFYLSGRKGYCK